MVTLFGDNKGLVCWCLGYHGFKSFQELRCFNLLHQHEMKMIFLTTIIKWLAMHDLRKSTIKLALQYSDWGAMLWLWRKLLQYSFTVHWNEVFYKTNPSKLLVCQVIPSPHITIFDISIINCVLQSFWSSPFLVTWKSVSKNNNIG